MKLSTLTATATAVADTLSLQPLVCPKPSKRDVRLNAKKEFKRLLSLWRLNPLSPVVATQLMQQASRHLSAQGVPHAFHQQANASGGIIEISPLQASRSRLNQLAYSLFERHRTRLVFDVVRLRELNARASYLRPRPARGSEFGTIHLPTAAVLRPNKPDLSVAHEIVHSHTMRRLRRRGRYAFYGRAWGLENCKTRPARLPGAVILPNCYSDYFAFDEIDAHYIQLRYLTHQYGNSRCKRIERRISKKALRVYKLSVQSAYLAGQALAALKNGSATLGYVRHNGIVHARIHFVAEGTNVKLKMPLVELDRIQRKRAGRSLEKQLNLLHHSALTRAKQTYRRLSRISPQTAALQSKLPPLSTALLA